VTEQEKFYAKSNLEAQFKNGAGWFYWIAGLSLINTVVALFDGSYNFIAGLGITQLIDAFAYMLADYNGRIIIYVGVFINLLIIGMFVVFGVLAHKKKKWVFITGIVLYSLDALLFIFIKDYLSLLFHAYAVYSMYRGLKACNELQVLEDIPVDEEVEAVTEYLIEEN
jgi:hypothetical protein